MDITVVLASVVVFMVIVFLLVGMLLGVKAKLLPSGPVKLMINGSQDCLLYTSPSPRDLSTSRMPSSA